ncbi:hypothetical protein [Parasphingorhabdus litoris]|nr:hypothetical protein [Parasphingorhabdus litoris]
MADDMFALAACNQSELLASQLEFGHRLIALNHIQKRKIAEVEESSALLRSSVHRSKLREEHAASNLRQAEKFQHQKRADRHLRQMSKPDLAITRFRKGVS